MRPFLKSGLFGVAWAILSVAIFSGWFVVTLVGLNHQLQVWDIVALRFAVSALLLTPFLLFGKSKLPLRRWAHGVPLALLWGVPFIYFLATGIQSTSAILASAITPAMMPVFAGTLGWLVFSVKLSSWRVAGYSLIVLGLVILTVVYGIGHSRPSMLGIACLLIASTMWATYTLYVGRTGFSSIQATGLICFWSALLYIPIYVVAGLTNFSKISGIEFIYQFV